MYLKAIKLSLIVMFILMLIGCDSSLAKSSTQNDVVGFSFTLISHTKHEECFNSSGDSISCIDSVKKGIYLNKL